MLKFDRKETLRHSSDVVSYKLNQHYTAKNAQVATNQSVVVV